MRKITILKSEITSQTIGEIHNYCDYIERWFIPEKKPKGIRNKKVYVSDFATFDTETTNDKRSEQAFIYSWAFCFRGKVIIGRTLDSFIIFSEYISALLREKTLVCFVHNLAYDWSFLSGVYAFKKEDVFFTDPRKVLYANMYNIEFRCSYFLTGMSLKNFTAQMDVKHKKKSGEKFDYSKMRTPGCGLKRYEIEYIVNDVLGLSEALYKFMREREVPDNIWTLPRTKTGYVRRDLKKAVSKISYKKRMSWQLDPYSFNACLMASRGGNTHANRYWCDTVIKATKDKKICSFDFASCYPAVMLYSDHFPQRNFTHKGRIEFSDAMHFILKMKYCSIFKIKLYKYKLKDMYDGLPYLSLSKVQMDIGSKLDNGRIIEGTSCITWVTDLDLLILINQYTWKDIDILDSYVCASGKLPKEVRDVIQKYYERKTALKGLSGTDPESGVDYEILYNLSKTYLNATFGCMCMNPCKELLIYDCTTETYSYDHEKTPGELLKRYNKKGFLPFSIGVFVCSIARFWLQSVYNMLPDKAGFIYGDTDSLKTYGVEPSIFDGWNKKIIEMAHENNVLAYNKKGEIKYLGLFELESDKIEKFVTLGAKKYCYTDNEGLHLTCAGVNKKIGAKELGTIENFKDGFVFSAAGGTKSKYNDLKPGIDDFYIVRNNERIHITKNIYISDTEYTLGRTTDYMELVQICKDIMEGVDIDNEAIIDYDE